MTNNTVEFWAYFNLSPLHFYYISISIKEGFFIDYIQNVTSDYLVISLFVSSANLFNANFFNLNSVSFFLDEIYANLGLLFSNNEDSSLGSLINNIINVVVLLLPVIIFTVASLTTYV